MTEETKPKRKRPRTPKKSQNNSAPKTEEQIDQEFLERHNKLCEELSRALVGVPAFQYSQERRAYDTVVNLQIVRLDPK